MRTRMKTNRILLRSPQSGALHSAATPPPFIRRAAALVVALAALAASADPATEPLVSRRYDVLPFIDAYLLWPETFCDPGDPFRYMAPQDIQPRFQAALRDYAAERGVTWPEGSGIEYCPFFGCVAMRNTEANHAVFRDVVARFAPFQVRCRVQFVSAAPDAFAALGLEDVLGVSLDAEKWAALRARLASHPGAELRGCVSLLSDTGAQATEKSVVEYTYPTEFGVEPLLADSGALCAAVEPQNFVTREVGETVQFTPRVFPGPGYGIDRVSVDAVTSTVFPAVWNEYASSGFRVSLAQPFFPVFSALLSADVLSGRTIAFGGTVVEEPGKGPRHELVFLTAEVVGLDGRPIPFAPRTTGAADAAPGLVSRRFPVYHLPLADDPMDPADDLGTAPGDSSAPAGDGDGNLSERESAERALRAICARVGIDWPAGAGVWCDPADPSVEIRNTPENVERLRAALARALLLPVQIRVRTRFAAATPEAFEALGLADRLGGQLSPGEWATLREALDAAPGVETLACPSTLVQAGAQTFVRGCTEIVYPTEFETKWLEAAAPAGAPTNARPAVLGVAAEPQNFQTREVGQFLDLTARLSADRTRISIDFSPHVVYPPEWKDCAALPSDAGPAGAAVPFVGRMEQPFFPAFSLAMSLDLKCGRTAVLGGSLLDVPGRGPRHHLVFLTAELVDLEGNPVPVGN